MGKKEILKSSLIIAALATTTLVAMPKSEVRAADAIVPNLTYSAHVQRQGWQKYVKGGEMAGTKGQGLRAESIRISLDNVPEDVEITYNVHQRQKGWTGWVANNEIAGKTGLGLQAEAIKVSVKGLEKYGYELQYHVHIRKYGWLNWVTAKDDSAEKLSNTPGINAGYAGSVGQGLRIEAIEMRLVKIEPVQEETNTVQFKDTKNYTTTVEKTDSNGIVSKIPEISNKIENGVEYRLLGWAKSENATAADVIDLEKEVITEDTTLYSVWVKKVDVKIVFNYDGQTEEKDGKQETITEEKTGYLAGDTIDLTDLEKLGIDVPEHKSTTGDGVTYEYAGWYAENDKEQRELTTYTIPVQTSGTTYTVNLHPAWKIKSVTSGDMTDTVINNVITELTTLQTKNKGTCGEVEINSVTKISNKLGIPEGVSVKFDKNVTVDENGYITGAGTVIEGPEATITKVVNNTNAADNNKGLNAALNTDTYDTVQLKDAISSLSANIEIKEGKKAVLDLNGNNLTMGDTNTFKIDGEVKATAKTEGVAAAELTIINSKEAGKTVASNEIKTKTGIENKGKLTIGEKAVEGEKAKDLVKISSETAATAATITNAADATLTLESGIIENASTSANAITDPEAAVVNNKGTLIIEDGKIEASNAAKIPALLNEGTATIKDGEILRSKNSASVGAGYYVVVNHGEMTIDGGTFSASDNSTEKVVLNGSSALIENGYTTGPKGAGKKTADLTINDGTFKGGRYVVASDYAGYTKIHGGKYEAVLDTSKNLDTAGKTRSIFKVVGKLELNLDESKETEFNLGANAKTQTALVLIGDQYLSEYNSKNDSMHECNLTIYPFSPEIVKVNKKGLTKYEDVGAKIVNEKTSDNQKSSKSNVVVYVGNSDAKEAGKQLMAVIKNSIASKMTGVDAEKNTATIILDSDVEIESDLDTTPNYETSKENTTLDLNGHTLTIHKLAVFKKNVNVIDKSEYKTGTIVLSKDKDTTIYLNGDFAKDVNLSELAAQEVDKED